MKINQRVITSPKISMNVNNDSMPYGEPISKQIFQTWKTNKVPEKWVESPKSIKEHMPDWKYVLMTDDDNRKFVAKHFPDFLSHYDKFPHPIQRADAIRYCYLYINGGLYMDLDIKLQKPLDELLTGDICLVCSGNIGSCITNSIMYSAKPGHKLWLDCIEEMKKPVPWYTLSKHFEIMSSTGPVMLNRVVKKSLYTYSLLPTKSIMPCSVCDQKCVSDTAYAVPLEGGSWNSWDSLTLNFLMCNWKSVVMFIVLVVVFIIAYFLFR